MHAPVHRRAESACPQTRGPGCANRGAGLIAGADLPMMNGPVLSHLTIKDLS
jgi:hypothetical protein